MPGDDVVGAFEPDVRRLLGIRGARDGEARRIEDFSRGGHARVAYTSLVPDRVSFQTTR